MINYVKENSPFYLSHENFCKKTEAVAAEKNARLSGECTSFGYEADLSFTENDHAYTIRFIKTQTTQNGIYLPINATEYHGVEATVQTGISNTPFEYGRSSVKRMMMPEALRQRVPDGYYFSQKNMDDAQAAALLERLIDLDAQASLHNGFLKLVMRKTNLSPESLIDKVLQLTATIAKAGRKLPHHLENTPGG